MPKWVKIAVFGDHEVGKTAIIEQLITGRHNVGQVMFSTVEDTYETTIDAEKGLKQPLRLYDTAGQTRTQENNISKHLIGVVDGFVLVYSVTSMPSFRVIQSIKKRLDQTRRDAPIVILGTKTDLKDDRQCIPGLAATLTETDRVKVCEVSVKERKMLLEPFTWIVKKVVATWGKGYLSGGSEVKKYFSIRRVSGKGVSQA